MNTSYCSACDKEAQTQLVSREEIINVRGQEIKVTSSILKCIKCNNEIYDEELETRNLEKAYSEYRKMHCLLAPTEIKEIRERYNMSQRGLSRLLGWGEITLHRYESGAIQDEAHNTVLLLIADAKNMQKVFEKNRTALTSQEAEKLERQIGELLAVELEPQFNNILERLLSKNISELTGFVKFDLEKTKNMILLILEFQNTFATKINKLLWYMDFLHFNNYSVSIAGNAYFHYPYGPVPDGYELILGMMQEEGLMEKEGILRHEAIQELLKPKVSFDKKIFSAEELKTMRFVLEKFKDFSCSEISEYSHKETAYLQTEPGETISYSLAKTLSLSKS